MQYSVTYTIAFAAAVCLVCSLVVAITAVTLKPRQVANALLDKQRKVLAVAGLTPAGQKLSDQEVEDLFVLLQRCQKVGSTFDPCLD